MGIFPILVYACCFLKRRCMRIIEFPGLHMIVWDNEFFVLEFGRHSCASLLYRSLLDVYIYIYIPVSPRPHIIIVYFYERFARLQKVWKFRFWCSIRSLGAAVWSKINRFWYTYQEIQLKLNDINCYAYHVMTECYTLICSVYLYTICVYVIIACVYVYVLIYLFISESAHGSCVYQSILVAVWQK